MKSKGRAIVIISLLVLLGITIVKVVGFQFSGIDKKAILTIEDITE